MREIGLSGLTHKRHQLSTTQSTLQKGLIFESKDSGTRRHPASNKANTTNPPPHTLDLSFPIPLGHPIPARCAGPPASTSLTTTVPRVPVRTVRPVHGASRSTSTLPPAALPCAPGIGLADTAVATQTEMVGYNQGFFVAKHRRKTPLVCLTRQATTPKTKKKKKKRGRGKTSPPTRWWRLGGLGRSSAGRLCRHIDADRNAVAPLRATHEEVDHRRPLEGSPDNLPEGPGVCDPVVEHPLDDIVALHAATQRRGHNGGGVSYRRKHGISGYERGREGLHKRGRPLASTVIHASTASNHRPTLPPLSLFSALP